MRHKENRLLDKAEQGGKERGTYGESNMETYITIRKTDSQREFAIGLRELTPRL